MEKLVIAIDFDGVINGYKGYKGKGNFEQPVPYAALAIQELKDNGHTIIINTCRPEIWIIRQYLIHHEIPFDHINFNPQNVERELSMTKINADIYIDDKNIEFNGSWMETLNKVENFKPWWRR